VERFASCVETLHATSLHWACFDVVPKLFHVERFAFASCVETLHATSLHWARFGVVPKLFHVERFCERDRSGTMCEVKRSR
jgi:transposase